MSTRYEQISEDQMKAAIADFRRPPDRSSLNPRQETTYDWLLSARASVGPRLAVRLYSSVVPAQGEARECGADAIRIAVVASPGTKRERVLLTLKRVHRTPGWADRMRQRLRDAWMLVRHSPACPACGAYMLPRTVRVDKTDRKSAVKRLFWSCTNGLCRGATDAKRIGGQPPKTIDELVRGTTATEES